MLPVNWMNGFVAETHQPILSNLWLAQLIWFAHWLMLSNLERDDIPLGPFSFRTRPFADRLVTVALRIQTASSFFLAALWSISLQRWSEMLHVSLVVASYPRTSPWKRCSIVLSFLFFVCSSCTLLYWLSHTTQMVGKKKPAVGLGLWLFAKVGSPKDN